MRLPRILFAAAGSGNGKTLITCAVLQALVNRGIKTASFKCGPDYIDPMFHSKIIGTHSKNLDTFFTDSEMTKYLFAQSAKEAELSVMEGVMGYYDGLAGVSTKASAYDLAMVTKTPVILIIDCKGMSLSVIALIKGLLEYKKKNQIKGVILNRISKVMYDRLKEKIESELPIKVFGYFPLLKEKVFESRHLGLIMPEEILKWKEKLNQLSKTAEETIDIKALVKAAEAAPGMSYKEIQIPKLEVQKKPKIAVAVDEAFCFYYEDNLSLLRHMGAELMFFSPLYDEKLPDGAAGLLLGGGYPELYAEELSKNTKMRKAVRESIAGGMPCMAECGGFLYLHHLLEGTDGKEYEMSGVIAAKAYRTDKLQRFGYVTLAAQKNQMIADTGDIVKAHEFHYWESTECGSDFLAEKPLRKNSWECIHGSSNLAAGFPHLYYYSNMSVPYRFLQNACFYKREGMGVSVKSYSKSAKYAD